MRKHISVFGFFVKSSLFWVLLIMVVLGAAEVLLFERELTAVLEVYEAVREYFTAPEKVVAGDKKLYAAGSVVETWNAAEKKWENPVYLSGSSRRLTVAESSVARRLTWKWKSMNHLRILVR